MTPVTASAHPFRHPAGSIWKLEDAAVEAFDLEVSWRLEVFIALKERQDYALWVESWGCIYMYMYIRSNTRNFMSPWA